MPYQNFFPCNPYRKPDRPVSYYIFRNSYILDRRHIILCPKTLDNPKGLSLEPYRTQDLAGDLIDSYQLLPFVLFHELLHTEIVTRKSKSSSFPRHHIIVCLSNMKQSTTKKCKISHCCTFPFPIFIPLRWLTHTGSNYAQNWHGKGPIGQFTMPTVWPLPLSVSKPDSQSALFQALGHGSVVRQDNCLFSFVSVLGLYFDGYAWASFDNPGAAVPL